MGKKRVQNKSTAGDVQLGAPYGGRWLDGVFYQFVEPDAGLSAAQVRQFERWLVGEAKKAGKWTGRRQ